MKTFNKKSLFLALAGVSALGAVGAAEAQVQISPNGLGQVLLYPYYTTRTATTGEFNTLISVVNSTGSTKAVKVRFREPKASVEVLDFNLFLSPYDVWTGWLEKSGDGVILKTDDKSCTIPTITATNGKFRNESYKSDAANDAGLDRLREGYFEMIEMATYTDGSDVATNVKHSSAGVPPGCSKLQLVTYTKVHSEALAPNGGLTGTVQLVQPGSGFNSATDPTVLINFTKTQIYKDPNLDTPNLGDGDDFGVVKMDDGNVIHGSFANSQDAVSAVLMKGDVLNEFMMEPSVDGATEWLVTFPTKHFYVSPNGGAPSKIFTEGMSSTGSCDEYQLDTHDREEATFTPGGFDFSPSPQGENPTLCWEVNVLAFAGPTPSVKGSNPFAAHLAETVDVKYRTGWAQLNFLPKPAALLAGANTLVVLNTFSTPYTTSIGSSYTGLPAIGFATQLFRPASGSSYAGTFYHRFHADYPTFSVGK